MKFSKVIFTVCLCGTALLGDYIVFQSKYSKSLAFRAVTDSLVHATVGLFSSLLFFSREPILFNATSVYNVVLCTLASSIIDVDHFVVAKSILLKVKTSKVYLRQIPNIKTVLKNCLSCKIQIFPLQIIARKIWLPERLENVYLAHKEFFLLKIKKRNTTYIFFKLKYHKYLLRYCKL